MAETRVFSPFIPPHLLRELSAGRTALEGDRVLEGAFLFSDISGFTALSEKLSAAGAEGAERIAHEINRCFDPLLNLMDRHGGSVLRFGGDALLVYFPESDGLSCRHARAAASAVVRTVTTMKPVETPGGAVKLGVKVGLHRGRILGFVARLDNTRTEYVTLGAALNRLAECESAAERGQVVASADFRREIGAGNPQELDRLSRPARRLGSAPNITPAKLTGFLPAPIAARQTLLGEQAAWLAEMRRVTAMFINVDGLGRLADRAVAQIRSGDINAGRAIVRQMESYFAAVHAIAALHGGFFFSTDLYDHGDKVICVFGAPVSHERDEEHAVDAARDIAKLPEKMGMPIRQRIGLNSGQAFCGLIGNRQRRVYTVMGDTINTAARCMSAARWRRDGAEILTHENTLARTRGRYTGTRRAFAAKGKSKPVPVMSVRGERPSADMGVDSGLIGRDEERRRIESMFASGKGFILDLAGDAGVGKSTLLRFAAKLWQTEGGRVIAADCLPVGATAPFFPWRRALWNYFSFGDDPDPARVRRALGELGGLAPDDAALVAEMIGVEIGRRPPPLDPKQAVERRLAILRRIVERDPRALWVFEDVHWLDANSVDLLRRLAKDRAPCRVMVTHRPGQEIFDAGAPATSLGLKPFGLKESGELATRMLGARALRESTLESLHAKSEGNPFYLVELYRWILERGAESSIPDSISAVLQSRVDRLPDIDRETLRAAAVIGRGFFRDLLADVLPVRVTQEKLREILGRLETSDFVRLLGGNQYEFRHVLTQESVYESMTTDLRRRLHGQIARRLERRKQANHVLLAHHFDRAGVGPSAIEHLELAGRQAQKVYGNDDAIRCYSRAIDWLQKESAVRQRLRKLAEIFLRRADAHKAIGRFAQARADCMAAERIHLKTADMVSAALARDAAGVCLQREGRHREAHACSEQALRRLRRAGSPPEALARCLNSLTIANWYSGRTALAIEYGEESIRIRRRLKDPKQLSLGLFALGKAYTVVCDLSRAVSCFEELHAVSKRTRDVPGIAYALDGLGQCNRKLGRLGLALRQHRESFRLRESAGNRRALAYSCLNESLTYLTLGLPVRALPHLERAEQFLKETDEENLVGELWRYRGMAALESNQPYRAAICLERALRIAQSTGFLESEVNTLAPLARATSILGDQVRAAAICDRLSDMARAARIVDHCVCADLIVGEIAARQGDTRLAEESLRAAAEAAARHEFWPLFLEIAERWTKWFPALPQPDGLPPLDAVLRRLSDSLDDFDRRAFEARIRVLLG